MIPSVFSLQHLAADTLRASNISVDDQPDAEQITLTVREAQIMSLRSSIYASLQSFMKPSMKVLIDGINSRSELNATIGTVLSWKKSKERWAVKPFDGKAILLRTQNLLPIFPKQEAGQLKLLIDETRQVTQSSAMRPFLINNDRITAWLMIGKGYQTCPFLLLDRAFEILDSTARRPQLVHWAAELQSSLCKDSDKRRANQLRNQIDRSKEKDEQSHYYNYWHSARFEDEEIPAAYWFLLFVSLDAEEWVMAMECLDRILKDVKEGKWPEYFLTEVFHFLAIVEFAVKNKGSCRRMLKMYDAYSDTMDRHRYSAAILQLWVDGKAADEYHEAMKKDSELGQVATVLSGNWSSDAFSQYPWVAFQVASEIGTDYESPCAEVTRMIESQWEQIGHTPHHIDINTMKLPGFPHSVTVRHRKSRNTERDEQERHERNLQYMYEDRY